MANAEPVASEPRLFVGQVPTDKTAEDLIPLFEGFGVIKNLHLVKGPDGKSRGCAMVLFDRWSSAEAAMEKHDGKTVLDGGKGRALVVHFANPRKAGPTGMAPEQGVAPKKIFVGQVPRDITEEQLAPLFEECGEVLHLNILRTQKGQSSGCAFVQFRKWAEAESAIDRHNAKTVLPGAEVPLVVKFADARKKDGFANGIKRGILPDPWQDSKRQLAGGMPDAFLQGQMGMEGLASVLGAYGQYNGAQFTPEQQASLLSSLGMQNVLGNNSLASQQMNPSQYGGLQPVDLSNSNNLVNNGAAGLGMAGLNDGMYGQANLYGGRGVGSMGMPPARLNGQREGEMGNNMPSNGLNSMYGHAYGANGNSALYPGQYPGAMPRQQRMGSGGANEVSNQWKLFVGQLPPEATEADLWAVFSPVGEILELYVLRGPNGLSRGCGFITYANKFLAQQAIMSNNGKQMGSKVLVVKFADRSVPNKLM